MRTVENTAVMWNAVMTGRKAEYAFGTGRAQGGRRVAISCEMIWKGNLILVNERYPYRAETEAVWLSSPFSDQPQHLMACEASSALAGLLRSLQAGKRIVGVSGLRSMEEQICIWNDSEKENGLEFTRKFVAVPGHSEHQTGLAMDVALNQKQIDFICPQFPYEGICQEFRELSADFGFIERYPAGKEAVTGIGAEPWHFRYVGIPHARIMKEHSMALEEYVDWLRGFDWNSAPLRYWDEGKEFYIGWIACEGKKEVEAILPKHCRYAVSGNNVDGIIITAAVI